MLGAVGTKTILLTTNNEIQSDGKGEGGGSEERQSDAGTHEVSKTTTNQFQ